MLVAAIFKGAVVLYTDAHPLLKRALAAAPEPTRNTPRWP